MPLEERFVGRDVLYAYDIVPATQTGGLLVLNSVDEPERYSTYFMKIDGVKFRQKVVPGDTLILRLELLAPIRRGISTMKGFLREMPLEERFVGRDVLYAYDIVPANLDDLVNQFPSGAGHAGSSAG